MFDPLVGARELNVNSEANDLHKLGLEAEGDHDFAEAHLSFGEALEILSGLPDTIHTDVQTARVKRDDGFTNLREAITNSNDLDFQRAKQTVKGALGLISSVTWSDSALSSAIPERAAREVRTERGATVSLLGRIASAEQATAEERTGNTLNDSHLYTVGSQAFNDAHEDLRRGNNGYYLAMPWLPPDMNV